MTAQNRLMTAKKEVSQSMPSDRLASKLHKVKKEKAEWAQHVFHFSIVCWLGLTIAFLLTIAHTSNRFSDSFCSTDSSRNLLRTGRNGFPDGGPDYEVHHTGVHTLIDPMHPSYRGFWVRGANRCGALLTRNQTTTVDITAGFFFQFN